MSSKQFSSVIKFEFVRQIKKPSFWISILLMPALVIGMFLISMAASNSNKPNSANLDENTKIIISDESGILPSDSPFITKSDKEQGIEMVKNGDADLYFYIPDNFEETKKVELYHISEELDIFNNSGAMIKAILNQAVSSKFNDLDIMALTGDFNIDDNKLTATGEEANALGKIVVPLVFLAIFFLFIVLFGSRFLMTVVEEKENRISEMILTSVSAKHLIVGKIIAMMLLGIIQILTFVVPLVVAVFIYRDNPVVSGILSTIEIDPVIIAECIVLFVISVALVIGLCTYIGAITPTAKDASQFIGPIIIGLVFPLYFMSSFLAAEPNFLVQFLTFFPFSAPIALMLRIAFGTLSTPEFIIGCIEIGVLAYAVIWITIRTFQKNAINFGFVKPKLLKRK